MERVNTIRIGVAVASGIGPATARRIRERFGGWESAVAAAESGELPAGAARDGFREAEARGEAVAADCRRAGVRLHFRGGEDWPARMTCLGDAPEVLFSQGRFGLTGERTVGIVGSRECSEEGGDAAWRFGSRLAAEGWTVVSGLARGIDAAAHRGALDGSGDTIAVLGSGVDVTYPPENRGLTDRIRRDGLLVSEFAPGTPPRAENFPRRNRILAALSDAVLVVECRLRSGALVTAKHALEHGRDLYARPGSPASPVASGPLQLLRQGAGLVRTADDLLEDLGADEAVPRRPEERRALQAVKSGAATVDDLSDALGVGPEEARDRLARLELMGWVKPEAPDG